MNNVELNKTLTRIYEIKEEKNSVVRNQQYEKAAKLKDEERTLERKAYCILFDTTDDSYELFTKRFGNRN